MDGIVEPVITPRVRLVPCSRDMALANVARLTELIGADVPADWPEQDVRDFLPVYARQLEADASLLGWGIWLIQRAEPRTVIGTAGFKGKPVQASVEIGYGVLPAYRRLGYASEAVRALTDWAFSHSDVTRVLADCERDNIPSIRVLEKLGMRRTGENGTLVCWELPSRT